MPESLLVEALALIAVTTASSATNKTPLLPRLIPKNRPGPTHVRKAFVNWFYRRPNTPLRPAGLIGPVELRVNSPQN